MLWFDHASPARPFADPKREIYLRMVKYRFEGVNGCTQNAKTASLNEAAALTEAATHPEPNAHCRRRREGSSSAS
jgi:hypothetical protein